MQVAGIRICRICGGLFWSGLLKTAETQQRPLAAQLRAWVRRLSPVLVATEAGDVGGAADVQGRRAGADADALGKPAVPGVGQLEGVQPVKKLCSAKLCRSCPGYLSAGCSLFHHPGRVDFDGGPTFAP